CISVPAVTHKHGLKFSDKWDKHRVADCKSKFFSQINLTLILRKKIFLLHRLRCIGC
uniref:Uncharacterized protein n=2 Tax=Aegilops tauschii subsp. strangulata TaxID=200361 RepID=A0A453IGG0_AEGTS